MTSAHGYLNQTGGYAITGGGWQRWGHNIGREGVVRRKSRAPYTTASLQERLKHLENQDPTPSPMLQSLECAAGGWGI